MLCNKDLTEGAQNLLHICDRILENLPFGYKQTFARTQLKIFTILLKQVFG